MAKPNYPKGTTPKEKWDLPPDIFWITPGGVVIVVIGHLTAIQARPETFGLPRSPVSKGDINAAFQALWSQGWVRGRYSDGTFYFQMERPRGLSLGNAFNVVLEFKDHASDVEVSFAEPEFEPMGKAMTADDFLDQRFPGSWRINPGLGRR